MNLGDHAANAFGRRGLDRAPKPFVRDARSARPAGKTAGLAAILILLAMTVAGAVWAISGVRALDARNAEATARVVEIVNQPVTPLPRTEEAGVFSPGWFHPGAIKPDFARADVRASQEFPYAGYTYVTSDLDPSQMFVADELEFNAMTKYFYTDRTTPKKKLSEAEMVEINALYRLIGHDDAAVNVRWLTLAGLVLVGGVLVGASVSIFRRKKGTDLGIATLAAGLI